VSVEYPNYQVWTSQVFSILSSPPSCQTHRLTRNQPTTFASHPMVSENKAKNSFHSPIVALIGRFWLRSTDGE
jgi:hypothetical protein